MMASMCCPRKRGIMSAKRSALIAGLCLFAMTTTPTSTGSQSTAQTTTAQNAGSPAGDRKEEVRKLLATLRDVDLRKNHPDQVITAIRRLGELRASEAIDDLIELLTFSPLFPGEVAGPDGQPVVEFQLNRYPATGALFQIGRPALPALLRVIELNRLDSLKGQNAMDSIQNIFRDDLAEGVKYLENAAEASLNEYSAQDLRQAAARLRHIAAQHPAAPKN